jgi:hypothetical protein
MTKQFTDMVLHSEISMRPVLPLGLPVNLGHVGTIGRDGTFNHLGTASSVLGLNSLGTELPVQISPLCVRLSSGKDVTVAFGADAKTDGALAQFSRLSGKASISFGSADSFFVSVNGLKIRELAEPHLLLNPILEAFAHEKWSKDAVFIYRIGLARHLTVILASQSDTTVLLKASGKVTAAATADVDLAAGFKFVASTKAIAQITGGRGIAAFYDAYRVKTHILSEPQLERYRLRMPLFGMEIGAYTANAIQAQTSTEVFDIA